eukprot:7240461-Pyramimonas_sp.AAC.1
MSFAPNRHPVGPDAGAMRLMSKAIPRVNGPNQHTLHIPRRRLPQLKMALLDEMGTTIHWVLSTQPPRLSRTGIIHPSIRLTWRETMTLLLSH